MARVIFINRFYWPDERATAQLLKDLAEALATRGFEVTIITTRPADATVPQAERRNGVSIKRVASTRLGQRSLTGRAVDFATFQLASFWQLLARARRDDTVVAMTDPPLLGVVVWAAAWLRGARLLHWVQDIYPEIAVQITRRRSLLLLRPARDWVLRGSARCIVPGTDMARLLRSRQVPASRVSVSPNWAPRGLEPASAEELLAQRTAWGLAGKFVLAYSGNLGRAHDLTPLLDIAAMLRDDLAFAFVFVGDGAQRAQLEAVARERSLDHIRFLPAQPRERLAITLGVADVHFVTLLPGTGQYVFPSKLYGIARAERPVVFIGDPDGEVAAVVRERGLGLTFAREEIAAIAAALRQLRLEPKRIHTMQTAGRQFARDGFDLALATWERVLTPKLAVPPRSP